MQKSEIMQLGLGVSVSKNSSAGFWSMWMTWKILEISFEVTMSKFSHPSGSPASFDGKGSCRTRILRPVETARDITELKRDAFFGVVNKVIITPRCANILAMSIMGMM